MMASPDLTVGAIFGPQHGFRSDVQDNMIETPHANDCRRKVPVFSLYSETREPTSDMLRHVDVMVIDLQDIGARIYTYIYTMANCLRACAKHGVEVIVCDRPNPIGGVDVEGPMLSRQRVIRRTVPIPMSRHDHREARSSRISRDSGAAQAPMTDGASMSSTTRHSFLMPRRHSDADSAVVYPDGVVRGTKPRKRAHHPAVRVVARRGLTPNGRAGAEREQTNGVQLSPLFERLPETSQETAAAARFTCSCSTSAGVNGAAVIENIRAPVRRIAWRGSPPNTSTTRALDIWGVPALSPRSIGTRAGD